MTTELIIHLEASEDGEPLWWAEAPDVPGFYAAGGSLAVLRSRALDALRDIRGTTALVERMAGADDDSTDGPVAVARLTPA